MSREVLRKEIGPYWFIPFDVYWIDKESIYIQINFFTLSNFDSGKKQCKKKCKNERVVKNVFGICTFLIILIV